jgi:hypothetical protein
MISVAGKPRVGRIQLQIRRAFIAINGVPLTMREFPRPTKACPIVAGLFCVALSKSFSIAI